STVIGDEKAVELENGKLSVARDDRQRGEPRMQLFETHRFARADYAQRWSVSPGERHDHQTAGQSVDSVRLNSVALAVCRHVLPDELHSSHHRPRRRSGIEPERTFEKP